MLCHEILRTGAEPGVGLSGARLGAANRRYRFSISRSSQSKAIQLATHSAYSHTGMVVIRHKKPYVFEASGPWFTRRCKS